MLGSIRWRSISRPTARSRSGSARRCAHTWSAAQVKEGIADPGSKRLTDISGHWADPVGARVASWFRDAGWLPQSPEDGFGVGHPQFKYEIPMVGRTEDELLRGMNQQWRRNIKKAAKEGVEVTVSDRGPEDLKAFHDLYVHTAERDHFTPRPLRYFETMFAALSAEDPERIKLYLARHQGDLAAATLLVRVGTHAVYAYGASSTAKREVRGSNACQWAMIRDSLAAKLRRLRSAWHHPHPRRRRPARRPCPVQSRHRRPGDAVHRRVGPAAATDGLPGLRSLYEAARTLNRTHDSIGAAVTTTPRAGSQPRGISWPTRVRRRGVRRAECHRGVRPCRPRPAGRRRRGDHHALARGNTPGNVDLNTHHGSSLFLCAGPVTR